MVDEDATGGIEGAGVHTIDVWYSARRRAWILERLDEDGHLVGPPHRCGDGEDADHCLSHWLRQHGEHHPITVHRHPD